MQKTRIQRLVIALCLAGGLAGGLGACSLGGRQGLDEPAVVIERNKSAAPAWTRQVANKLYLEDEAYSLVYRRQNVADLKLGLKQGERQALQDMERHLAPLSGKQKTCRRRVADIYYERLAQAGQAGETHYDIYVLVQCEPHDAKATQQ